MERVDSSVSFLRAADCHTALCPEVPGARSGNGQPVFHGRVENSFNTTAARTERWHQGVSLAQKHGHPIQDLGKQKG